LLPIVDGVLKASLFAVTLYFAVISLFGLRRRISERPPIRSFKSFALIVAAHNEERVIGACVESLFAMSYPQDLFDVFVVADNCSDGTAAAAGAAGATVFTRNVPGLLGKGHALNWVFERVFTLPRRYDAICVFDADNLASGQFLSEINRSMQDGNRIVQGYLDSKNPGDSWITACYSIAFWTSNRLFQLARHNLGMSCQLAGTGFAVDTDVLRHLGWDATCLVEDLEFSCKLVMAGYRIGWAHDAVIYDEKPLTLAASFRQRKRWMQGFADVCSRFFPRLMQKALVDRDINALDCALYTMQPLVTLMLGIVAIASFVPAHGDAVNIQMLTRTFTPFVWNIAGVAQFLFTPFVMTLDRKLSRNMFFVFSAYCLNVVVVYALFGQTGTFLQVLVANSLYLVVFVGLLRATGDEKLVSTFIWYLTFSLYSLSWLPIILLGLIAKNDRRWVHTRHTRQILINQLEPSVPLKEERAFGGTWGNGSI
jgi:cellulose synthase/poly-beta-1,6-N-acetylglucosamine synthase-like glycosyltransferase